MELVYNCKKNGRSYTYMSAPGTTFASPQDEYSWLKGVREYADNYHASVTRKGASAFVGTDDEFRAEIDALCDEAHARWHAGDVPGTRQANPEAAAMRTLLTALRGAGLDPKNVDPAKLAKMAAKLVKEAA